MEKTMIKLWVDDMRDAPDDSWTVVRHVGPAIRILANMEVEEVSLDHDIENRTDDETYAPIAYFIGVRHTLRAALDDPWTPKITIHSINPVGAKEMQQVLHSYGVESEIKPYAPDIRRLKVEFGVE